MRLPPQIEGDGFSMSVTTPDRILRMDYTVSLLSNEVILRLDGHIYIKYLLTDNVTGDVVKGTNIITNVDGEIFITEGS